jgi:uncharacterized membrane protein
MNEKIDIDGLFGQIRETEPQLDGRIFNQSVMSRLPESEPKSFFSDSQLTVLAGALGCGLSFSVFPMTDVLNMMPTQFTLTPALLASVLGVSCVLAALTYWSSETDFTL